MQAEKRALPLSRGDRVEWIDAQPIHFSACRCFGRTGELGSAELYGVLGAHLLTVSGLALYGRGFLLDRLLEATPALASHIVAWIEDVPGGDWVRPTVAPDALPGAVENVFLCEVETYPRWRMKARLEGSVDVIEPDILAKIGGTVVPLRAWVPVERHIYPMDIPEISFRSGLDMLVIDCPARNLALMPNGLGYVHNALAKTGIDYQTFDVDIVSYHRYHIARIFDEGGDVILPSGKEMPLDPWQAEHYDLWSDPEVLAHMQPIAEETIAAIVAARPKILGLSIHQCNEAFSRVVVEGVRAALDDLQVIVGGFSCYNPEIGLQAFDLADYICIGEADLTIGPLAAAVARGERPNNMAGIVSRYDDAAVPFAPAPMVHDLDRLEFPKYDWFDLSVYRNYNGYQLTPIIASRGCRWSRCSFCAERFYWRIRSASDFVDELEWMVDRGCTLFMFNESDLNGLPEKLLDICDEVIRRGIKVQLTGQLRIHKKSDRAFFDKLAEAGFVALRFGVDAFAANALKLQKKGYTTEMISQNLKDCWEAGIYTEVNWVIGVPGETEADVDEGIGLILENRDYIGRLANINPLILVNGSVYWLDPAAHGIEFRVPYEQLLADNPRVVPADQWYSTNPHIDARTRKRRFEKIVLALHEAGFPVGAWADRVIEDVKLSRDRNRVGGAEPTEDTALPNDGRVTRAEASTAEPPELIESNRGYNIVSFEGQYFGLPQRLGPVNLEHEDVLEKPGIFFASSKSSVLQAINEHLFNARNFQRQQGSLFRAASSLSSDKAGETGSAVDVVMLRKGREIFAVPVDEIVSTVGFAMTGDRAWQWGEGIVPRSVRSHGSSPLLLMSSIRHNLIQFDGGFFAVPHSQPVDWEMNIVEELPGVFTAEDFPSLRALVQQLEAKTAPPPVVSKVPRLLDTIGDYNVVSYDGWVYGIPQKLGSLDLTRQDPSELPGVIRDRSPTKVTADVRSVTESLAS